MLSFEVRMFCNPYSHRLPENEFLKVLRGVAKDMALFIDERVRSGEFSRDSMGLVFMDPSAPPQTRSEDAVMAIVIIGPKGMEFIPNAAAKAYEHRDMGVDCGVLVYVQPHRLADGSFRYGFSAEVDGTIGGASGESEIQDRWVITVALATLNYRLQAATNAWQELRGEGRWFCDANLPGTRYSDLVDKKSMATVLSDDSE